MNKKNRVLLWRAQPAALTAAQWDRLTRLLDAAEQLQAQRFRFESDQRAYVLAHGLRRLALAAWLEVPAASLLFSTAASGQPQLQVPAHPLVYFSHSHTREAVLVALSADAAVGVDVENQRHPVCDSGLLDRFVERPDAAEHDFYAHWTALEACCKAAGTGLTSGQPRLHFERHAAGHWLATPLSHVSAAARRSFSVFAVTAPPGCCARLALLEPVCTPPQPLADRLGWRLEERDFARDGDALMRLA